MRIQFSVIVLGIGGLILLSNFSASAIGLQTYSQTFLKERILQKALKLHDALNPQDKADLEDASYKLYPLIKDRLFLIHAIMPYSVSLTPTSPIRVEDFEKILPKDTYFSFSEFTLDATKVSDVDVDRLRRALPNISIDLDRTKNEIHFSDLTPNLIHSIKITLPHGTLIKTFSIYAHIPVNHSIKFKRNNDSREFYDPSTYIKDTYRALQKRKKEATISLMKRATL